MLNQHGLKSDEVKRLLRKLEEKNKLHHGYDS